MNSKIIEGTFKIILIGNSGVGKTSILQRYIFDSFYDNMLSTIGLSSKNKEITLKNGKTIMLQLFDTAGQERFHSLSRSYFRNTNAVLFVYAVNDKKSFENIRDWIKIFMENHNGKKDIPFYLIENKNDLNREIEENLIDDFLNEYNFGFKSVSANEMRKILLMNCFKKYQNYYFKNLKIIPIIKKVLILKKKIIIIIKDVVPSECKINIKIIMFNLLFLF